MAWLNMGQQGSPTQQEITSQNMKTPQAQYSYLDNPDVQNLLAQLEQNRQASIENQKMGISDYEKLLKDHIEKNATPQLDLSPLMALTDQWTGSKLASSYTRPSTSKATLETTAALQQGLQKAKGALTDDEQQYLLSRLGMYQKADDAYLRSQLGQNKLDTQEEITRDKIAAAKSANGGLNLTPGQKKMDVDYAAEANTWSSSGRNEVESNLARLRAAQAELADNLDNSTISGRITGSLPDVLRTEQSRRLQQDIQESALAGLKAALGGQFTEKENKMVLALKYDPKLSPRENLDKVNRTIDKIINDAKNSEAKYQEFMAKGTLKDYGAQNKAVTTSNPKQLSREEKIKLLQQQEAEGEE